LLEKRREQDRPATDRVVLEGKRLVRVVVVVAGEADLLEVVGALGAGGSGADLLDGGEQQADEDGDDGDHHQNLDQRERRGPVPGSGRHHGLSPDWNTSRFEFGPRCGPSEPPPPPRGGAASPTSPRRGLCRNPWW